MVFNLTPETIVTSLGIGQSLFFGVFILAARRHNSANIFLAGFMFAMAAVWVGDFFLAASPTPEVELFFLPIDTLLAPLMFLYALELTAPTPGRLSRRHLLHLSAAGVALLLLLPWVLLPSELKHLPIALDLGWAGTVEGHLWPTGDAGPAFSNRTAPASLIVATLCLFLLIVLYQAQLTAYVVALIVISRGYQKRIRRPLPESDRAKLRWLGFLCVWCVVIWLTVVPVNLLEFAQPLGAEADLMQEIAQLAIIYLLGFAGVRQPLVFSAGASRTKASVDANPEKTAFDPATSGPSPRAQSKYARSGLSTAALERIAEKLKRAMYAEHLYLECSLTLPQLAKRTGISANHISQVLNEHLGRNFFDFVNGFRVEAAKGHLLTSDRTILDIALASGFNSKSTFNAAFKKIVGQTPGQYRSQRSATQLLTSLD